MDPFTIIGICTFLYVVIHTFLIFLFDCDIRLKIAEKFGKGIGEISRFLLMYNIYFLGHIIYLRECAVTCFLLTSNDHNKYVYYTYIFLEAVQGKVIWVTGASSGIGEHLAIWLAKGGAKVVLSARRQGELERVKQACLGMKIKNTTIIS
jgi:peptidyl-tRNA hydrolase